MVSVSVVMPVFNAAPFLRDAIKSILQQTLSEFEFIIVNDGSTDNSLEIIKSFKDNRIVLIDQKNQGLSKTLNIAINASNGKYIARIDADDIAAPKRLELQTNYLNNHPDCVLLGSNANIIDQNGSYLYTTTLLTQWHLIENFLPENPLYHSATFFRKDIWLKAGGYPEEITHHFEDKILWNRMSAYGKIINLKEALISYRITPSSISNKNHYTIKKLKAISNRIITTGKISEQDIYELNSITNKNINRLSNYYFKIGLIHLKETFNQKEAIKNFKYALYHEPSNKDAWLNLMRSFLPKRINVFISNLKLKIA